MLNKIRYYYHTFSSMQKAVADYILNNPLEVTQLTIQELSKKTNSSTTTVSRLLAKMEIDSYRTFTLDLMKDISGNDSFNKLETKCLCETDSIEEIANKIFFSTKKSIDDLKHTLNHDHYTTMDQLVSCIESSNQIYVLGVGTSSSIALDFFHKLVRLGKNVVTLSDAHMIKIACSNAKEDDLVIAISNSGESMDIIDGIQLAKKNHCKIASITSSIHSTIGNKSDITIYCTTIEENHRPCSMTSRILQLLVIDTIITKLLFIMGEDGKNKWAQSRQVVQCTKKKKPMIERA